VKIFFASIKIPPLSKFSPQFLSPQRFAASSKEEDSLNPQISRWIANLYDFTGYLFFRICTADYLLASYPGLRCSFPPPRFPFFPNRIADSDFYGLILIKASPPLLASVRRRSGVSPVDFLFNRRSTQNFFFCSYFLFFFPFRLKLL